jgi:hypothetical protein
VNDGWYLVKIVGGWMNAIRTEAELRDQRYEIQRKIFKHKMDKLSDHYVHKMMLDENPTIKRNAFNTLESYLGKKVLRPEIYDEWDLSQYTSNQNGTTKIDESMILAIFKSGNITIDNFLSWYNMRKDYYHLNMDSRNGFRKSLENTIWQMLRNKFLIKRASQRKLTNRDIIKQQKQWWLDKIVYAAMKDNIAKTIKITDKKLFDFYEDNKKDYCYKTGKYIPFNKVKINVKSDFIRQEYMAKMYRYILKLKQNYPIEINDDVLAKIRVRDENDPKAIDVYFVKKGGTFPRQAHPTIDWEWRTWF